MSIFKQRYDLEKRRRIAQDILTKFPNYVPVIVESTDKKTKQRSSRYLLDGETSVTRLIYEIRSQLNIDYHQSLFFFVHGTMLPTTLSWPRSMIVITKAMDYFISTTVASRLLDDSRSLHSFRSFHSVE